MLEQKEREKRVNSIIIRGLGTNIDNLQDKFNELVSFLLAGILPSSTTKTLNFASTRQIRFPWDRAILPLLVLITKCQQLGLVIVQPQPSLLIHLRQCLIAQRHHHILAITGAGSGSPPLGGPSPSVPNANPATTLPRSKVGDSNSLLSLDVSASVEGAEAATSPGTGP
ncbi:hypothetical protein Pcinc_031939 [Petrolisthes cinctipes]|uniref:Uncharacterized protein n=1 Tax=Petrolisthes cinctipes TaxID=88211 RepID=A0AAE1EV59_PETCI|nr:hypothetical protein Pcinc_031939 [Petrolisthes cinctipes]